MTDTPVASRVPQGPEDLTAEWLTGVLRADGTLSEQQSVQSAERVEFGEGVGFLSHLHRLAVRSDGPAPETVIVKLPTTTQYRELADGLSCYQRETIYYAQIAPHAPMRAPHAYLAALAEQGSDFVLVLEDLAEMHGSDQLEGLTSSRFDSVVDALAALHAWSLTDGADRAAEPSFPAITEDQMAPVYTGPFPQAWETYRANARQPIPAAFDAFAARFPELAPDMLARLASPAALAIGDFRVDNMFFGPDDELAAVDYQFVMRATGVYDVAYVASQGVHSELRSGRDQEIVRRYLDQLAAHGDTSLTFEQAWEQYRIAVAVQLAFPMAAMLWWDALPDRAKHLLLTLVERCIAAVEETDALAAVGISGAAGS